MFIYRAFFTSMVNDAAATKHAIHRTINETRQIDSFDSSIIYSKVLNCLLILIINFIQLIN